MGENNYLSSADPPAPPRPSITLPPRSSVESLFTGGSGASPGPLTLVSSFFSNNDPGTDGRSLSQLLACAVASPERQRPVLPAASREDDSFTDGCGGAGSIEEADFRFEQNRPPGLVITQPQIFTIPPGLSPATLLESPGVFPGQGSFGISHQQAQAHVFSSSSTSETSIQQNSLPYLPDTEAKMKEPSHFSDSDKKSQPSYINVDKPADDGYNWKKYGQKQVKGSEFPRSYYKCTHPGCPVKKKVERSLDGIVTQIIYDRQHNHQPPSNKRSKDVVNPNEKLSIQGNGQRALYCPNEVAFPLHRLDQEFSQAAAELLSSDDDEVGDDGSKVYEGHEDEPDPKRRNMEVRVPEQASSHRTLKEQKIIVQTTSEVAPLEDGYRWRKYGQKVVKGNPFPRSYYRCTNPGCNVRKQVERASTDPKAVMTTYEGKHNHHVPAAQASSHNTTSNSASQLRLHDDQNTLAGKRADFVN
ncbi:hypothetical protein Nepgr_029432 [Nepenthes gracilis]|uniref:WRKY domain-containing protein n=1 Tax=Nepenthes gracilis TaxID=150966 RepID=A0AAD3TEH2_NEPGR|nr:hypothetical protein Nepgr_029432 [Nepenthes gracilis]